jgi:hypothetical protein
MGQIGLMGPIFSGRRGLVRWVVFLLVAVVQAVRFNLTLTGVSHGIDLKTKDVVGEKGLSMATSIPS